MRKTNKGLPNVDFWDGFLPSNQPEYLKWQKNKLQNNNKEERDTAVLNLNKVKTSEQCMLESVKNQNNAKQMWMSAEKVQKSAAP